MAGVSTECSGYDLLHAGYQRRPRMKRHSTKTIVGKDSCDEQTCDRKAPPGRIIDGFLQPFHPTCAAESVNGDVVLEAAQSILVRFNNSFIAHCGSYLELKSLDTSTFPYTGEGEPTFYALLHGTSGAYVRLRLAKHISERQPPHVEIDDKGEWRVLVTWLEDLLVPNKQPAVIGSQGYELQWAWWQTNGQHFRLLDLPADIFEMVMLYLVGETVHLPSDYVMTSQPLRSHVLRNKLGNSKNTTNRSVLQLNRLCRAVAWPLILHMSYKIAHHDTGLSSLDTADFKYLHRLELSFSHEDFFHFFGVRAPHFEDDHVPKADILFRLEQLRYLQLDFESTLHRQSSPWYVFQSLRYVSDVSDKWIASRNDWMDCSRFPCQKEVVDWILSYAYQYIRHIERVELAGYIKDVTKDKWHSILERHDDADMAKLAEQYVQAVDQMPLDAV